MHKRHDPRVVTDDLTATRSLQADQQPEDVTMLNISVSGTAILSARPLGQIDDEVMITVLNTTTKAAFICLPCLIRYIIGERPHPSGDPPKWLHGAQFRDLDPEASVFVRQYVEDKILAAEG